ncbi:MAG: TolC family protein [Verrucomicrobiae bacterium]|nr:TolC family protein [Verrucomicrobiae bacterium]
MQEVLDFLQEAIDALKAMGLPPVKVSEGEAFRIAVQRRLDLLNEIDRFEDSKRKIVVAANLLKTQLDFFGGVSVESLPPTDYADFQWEDFQANAGLRLNLPIDRLRERNVYRTTFINFERQLRALGLALDNLRSGVRETVRDLELLEASYEIQKRSVDLADARVESAELLLQAGRVQVRDLLEAQNDQLRARNAFTVALIDYHVRRLEFLQDLGVLNINEEKFWLRAALPGLNDPVPPPSIPTGPEEVPVSPEQIIGLK